VADEERPFEDVRREASGFSIPELKWRELLFVGALRPAGGACYVRDPSRPLPLFRDPDLFPEGVRLSARLEAGRVHISRV
jgi:hypothetical protein